MKTTEIVIVNYKIELDEAEQAKFAKIPYGWNAKREGTDIPVVSDIAWNRAESWQPLSEPFFLSQKQYEALVEYLSK